MNKVFGRKLGQYTLLEKLGEGGMATVYNALDSRVERNVAIKVILPSKRTSSVFLQQFEREAKALANLTHTNIVKVLNYGIQDGQPYLVMEYIPGGTLKDAMGEKIPWQTAAAILAPIARALDYVHRQQIVHRDVKPSNILLHEDFRPMLSDFGILKLLEHKEEKIDSAIAAGIGTPEYMSPEQGMGQDVDFRADIYSLGLVFYEMITAQKPYTADSPMAIVIKHMTDELPLPTKIDKNIPKFVERAILRAVQKNPKHRYISMEHFADVLEMIAQGDKASPKQIDRAAREKEEQRRSLSILTVSIVLATLVVGTSVLAYNYLLRPQPLSPVPSTVTPTPATLTPIPSSEATSTGNLIPPATEHPALSQGNTLSNITLLETPIVDRSTTQFGEIARWGIGGVNVVRWSPDAKLVALGTTSGIFLYAAETHEMVRFIDTEFNVLELAFDPRGGEITAGATTGIVRTWTIQSGEPLRDFTYTSPSSDKTAGKGKVTAISYSADGYYLLIGYQNGVINYFSTAGGNALLAVDNSRVAEDIALSGDNRFIYASNGSNDIGIWDVQFGTKDKTGLPNGSPINNLSISHDQRLLLAGGEGSSVYLWDLNESKQISSFTNAGGRVTDFDFSSDDQYVAVGWSTGEIQVFKTPGPAEWSNTQVPVKTFQGFGTRIVSLVFSPKRLILAGGNLMEGWKLWDALEGKEVYALDQELRAIESMYLSGDGLWLATAHQDGLMRVWDVNAAQEAYPAFKGYLPRGVPFSPDHRLLAFIHSPGTNQSPVIRVLELRTGKIVSELPNYIPGAFIQFSVDSQLLVMGTPHSANIWDVSTWEQLNTHGGLTAGCGQFLTPHNDLLAIISNGGILFTGYDSRVEKMCGSKPPGAIFMYYFYEQHYMLFVLDKGELWPWNFNGVALNQMKARSTGTYLLPGEIFLGADQASGWYAYKDLVQGTIRIEKVDGGTGTTIDQQNDYQYKVALQPAQHLIALGSKYGSIHIWTMP
jgi:serine/threonine protein kinase